MREFLIKSREPPVVVVPEGIPDAMHDGIPDGIPDGLATPEPAPPSPAPRRAQRKRGERGFVVRYRGALVGFFEAEAEITPREAFLRVAQALSAAEERFDAGKLEICKPVPLKSARPRGGSKLARGELRHVAHGPGRAPPRGLRLFGTLPPSRGARARRKRH